MTNSKTQARRKAEQIIEDRIAEGKVKRTPGGNLIFVDDEMKEEEVVKVLEERVEEALLFEKGIADGTFEPVPDKPGYYRNVR